VSKQAIKQTARVLIGAAAVPVGQLAFVRDARREYSAFSYDSAWLKGRDVFEISPDLPLHEGWINRRAISALDSPFHFAVADTVPDAWGERIIRRAHAKMRAENPALAPLTAFDLLSSVDDISRIGALRLQNERGEFLRESAHYRTPHLVDLGRIANAARKVERGVDTAADLAYLKGNATSLGGLRPKSTVLEEDGSLAIGKFQSVKDSRSVVRGEVLAMKLASRAGVTVAGSRVVVIDDTPVAVIRRFDRTEEGARVPYLSGGSMLQARHDEDHSYAELADAIRALSAQPTEDVQELWRRLVVNFLMTNVDDHLWNVGFLYAGGGKWRLAPAFDLNPFPDKARESKTWLMPDTGPITSLEQLIENAAYFSVSRTDAEAIVAKAVSALTKWRELAVSREVGLTEAELEDWEPAFAPHLKRA
jgi:serine/threonine-protein kinase HipA